MISLFGGGAAAVTMVSHNMPRHVMAYRGNSCFAQANHGTTVIESSSAKHHVNPTTSPRQTAASPTTNNKPNGNLFGKFHGNLHVKPPRLARLNQLAMACHDLTTSCGLLSPPCTLLRVDYCTSIYSTSTTKRLHAWNQGGW